jgi:hypothetical protein
MKNYQQNQLIIVLSSLFLLLMVTGCQTTTPPPDCSANPAWWTEPSLPDDQVIDDFKTNSRCDFQQFSWQTFLYLIQPAEDNTKLVFETWETKESVFNLPQADCAQPGDRVLGQLAKISFEEFLEAGRPRPLVDQNGNWVHYEQRANTPEITYIDNCQLTNAACRAATPTPAIKLPPLSGTGDPTLDQDSIEIKTSWRVMTAEEIEANQYYMIEDVTVAPYSFSESCKAGVTLGLVGVHIVHKTPGNHEWVWSTFEHINNVPQDGNVTPPDGFDNWSFFNPENPSCVEDGNCTINTYFNPCGDAGTFDQCPSGTENIPAQIYRTSLLGQPLTSDQQPDPSHPNIVAPLNQDVQAMLMDLLPEGESYWSNYQLVGTLWTKDGKAPSTGQQNSPNVVGQTALANTTMETYYQPLPSGNLPSGVTAPAKASELSCFVCHTSTNNDFSHFLSGLPTPSAGDSCPTSELPDYCGYAADN